MFFMICNHFQLIQENAAPAFNASRAALRQAIPMARFSIDFFSAEVISKPFQKITFSSAWPTWYTLFRRVHTFF